LLLAFIGDFIQASCVDGCAGLKAVRLALGGIAGGEGSGVGGGLRLAMIGTGREQKAHQEKRQQAIHGTPHVRLDGSYLRLASNAQAIKSAK